MSDTTDKVFDEMVNDILDGETLVADFETNDPGGLTITIDYESLSITDDDIDIVLSGEILDTIHLFLEVRHTARETVTNVDWDRLLQEITHRNSENN